MDKIQPDRTARAVVQHYNAATNMTMHNTQRQFCYSLLPDQHHISDVAIRRLGGTMHKVTS